MIFNTANLDLLTIESNLNFKPIELSSTVANTIEYYRCAIAATVTPGCYNYILGVDTTGE
jgi:hypothetical protein